MTDQRAIPPSPRSSDIVQGGSGLKPYEVDPELASAKLAERMMERMPTPGIVSKPFVVWLGIFRGLNHTEDNKTYCNTSLYVSIFEGVLHNSVNINGALFEKFWTYMNKPKMIVQGIAGQTLFQEDEEKKSIWDRMTGWFRGGEKKDDTA